jgi:hypothetical protein
MIEKKCKACGIVKPLEAYNRQKAGKHGRRSQCRDCQKAESKVYLQKNGKQVKQRHKERQEAMRNRDFDAMILPPMLTCAKCGEAKPPSEYHNNKTAKWGKTEQCKTCVSKRDHSFRQNNPEKRYLWDRRYREENKEKIKTDKREWAKNKRATDPIFRLQASMRSGINHALKRQGKSKAGESMIKHLPYTIETLKEHLEAQFDDKMTWDNYGSYWHVDHIYPQSKLPYDSMDHPNFLKAWALSNLQPLEAIENMKKSNKILDTTDITEYNNTTE